MEEDYPSDLDYGGYLLRKAVSYTEQDLLNSEVCAINRCKYSLIVTLLTYV